MRRIAIALMLATAGCTHVDTGQIEYRIADAPNETREPDSGGPLRPARVYRQYQPSDNSFAEPFKKSDIYSIEIEQGVIGSNILEGEIFGHQFGEVGEFAILANVFEFAGSADQAAQNRFLQTGEFSSNGDDPSDVELKLVYFGDDVRRHQPFNFSNIPLKPRSAYNGGSIGIQIVVMEVDVQSGPMGSLLTTLARFGQQAVPGPSELSDLLYDLGESLFSGGNTDDRLFEYRFVLSAPTVDPDAVQATFVPGRYVLRRDQQRQKEMSWQDVRLDHNTARLYRETKGTYEAIRDELYLVLNVRRYAAGTEPEFYTQQGWTAFRERLQKVADDESAPLTKVAGDIQKMVEERRSSNWRAKVMASWAAAEGHLRRYALRSISNDFNVQACADQAPIFLRRRDLARRDARDAVLAFVATYQLGAKKPEGDGEPEFALSDRNTVVSSVARFFMPWSGSETEGKFDTAAAFETAFVDSPASGELVTLALDTASSRGREVKACTDLATAKRD